MEREIERERKREIIENGKLREIMKESERTREIMKESKRKRERKRAKKRD